MKYHQSFVLKNGQEVLIRNGDAADGAAAYAVFNQTHEETDYLLSYPEENSFNAEQEAEFLQAKTNSANETELVAIIGNTVAGTAGIEAVGNKYKVRHRAEFGICVLKEYWGLGLGRLLTQSCIQCAKDAGYTQLELDVVAQNTRAVALYKSLGFTEFGRNPRGFCSKNSGYQELIYMLLEL